LGRLHCTNRRRQHLIISLCWLMCNYMINLLTILLWRMDQLFYVWKTYVYTRAWHNYKNSHEPLSYTEKEKGYLFLSREFRTQSQQMAKNSLQHESTQCQVLCDRYGGTAVLLVSNAFGVISNLQTLHTITELNCDTLCSSVSPQNLFLNYYSLPKNTRSMKII